MKGFMIICAGCGTENHRYYLPETCLCSECGERYNVEEWRDLEESKT